VGPRLGRGRPVPVVEVRPLAVPFAAAFGLLVAAENGYLAWLLWEPSVGLEWFVAAPLALALVALAGSALLLMGRRRAWLLLTVASALLLLVLLFLAVLFGALGGGQALWWALLLLVGPVGCLCLALRREVRDWRGHPAARRPAGGARRTGRSR
jgi:O-antigen/teichoic acid export membrane protein